jgi:hypothetical protein
MQQIYQKLEARQVWRLTESLWVLVQPDGKNREGPEDKLNSSRIRGLAFPLPVLPQLHLGTGFLGLTLLIQKLAHLSPSPLSGRKVDRQKL